MLRLGVLFQSNQIGATLPDNTGEIDPLEVAIGQANQMAFSPDGRRAVIASSDRSVRFYEVEGKRDLKRFIGHTASVWSVALSSDASRALSGGMDFTARLWDTATGQQLQKLEGHSSLVTCVAFTPDASKGVTGSLDGTVILWDLSKGKEIRRLEQNMNYVNALAVSSDGKFALIGADRWLRLWNLETGAEEKKFEGHTAAITCVAFSKDDKQALSGSDDRTVRLWDIATAKQIQLMSGHDAPVRGVAFNESGKWALSGSADSTVRLWQAASGKELGKFAKHGEPVVNVAFLDNGKQTLSGSRDLNLLPWNIEKFYPTSVNPPKESYSVEPKTLEAKKKLFIGGTLSKFALSADRKHLNLIDLSTSRLLVVDVETATLAKAVPTYYPVESVGSSRDGKSFLFLCKNIETPHSPMGLGIQPPRSLILSLTDTKNTFDYVADVLGKSLTEFGLDSKGNVYLSEALKPEVSIWSNEKQQLVGTVALPEFTGQNWAGSYLTLSSDERFLFLSTQSSEKGVVGMQSLAKVEGTPLKGVKLPSSPEYPVGGDFRVTSDGKFLVFSTGTVVAVGEKELKPVAKLDAFLSAAVDVESKTVFLTTPGDWLKEYSYPDWKWKGSWKIPGTAYQMAFDGKSGQLYLGVIDPLSIRSNPKARGFGDLWIVDTKELKR